MAKDKERILFLEDYLVKHSGEEYTVKDLLNICIGNGHPVSDRTLRRDLNLLMEYNRATRMLGHSHPIVLKGDNTNPDVFTMDSLEINAGELIAFTDSLYSSFSITAAESKEISERILKLAKGLDRRLVDVRAIVFGRPKSTLNPGCMVSYERIVSAMTQGVKVSFKYWDYTPDREKVLKHGGLLYKVSPYTIARDDDRLYLVGYCDHKKSIVNFRIDRMNNILVTEEPARDPGAFDPDAYVNQMFKMYDGDIREAEVTLLVENHLMKNMVDKFGEDFPFRKVDREHFEADVTVYPSSTFFAWVFQYGGKIKILGPDHVKADYLKLLSDA